MRSNINTERGQALVVIALSIVVLFGFAALALDGSAKFSDRRHAQNAADAAALAAAYSKVDPLNIALSNNSPTTGAPATCPPPTGVLPSPVCAALITAGKDRASSNGYDNNLTTNTVDVYTPPISGYYAGNDSYVQVIIKSDVKTYLARVIGINETTNTVQAVAYTKPAKTLAEGAMIISYDDSPNCSTGGTGGYSVSVSGASTVKLTGGGILLNSDEVCGFTIPNCANLQMIGGGTVNSVANNVDTGSCIFTPPFTPNINPDLSIAIPEDVTWPDEPPQCGMAPTNPYPFPTQIYSTFDNKWHDQWLIYPGYYTEFPPASLVSNKSYIYMASGVYCIDLPANQDVSWSAVDAAALIGTKDQNDYPSAYPDPVTGVTLYIKQADGFKINGNGPTYLDATTDPDSDYQGYLIILKGTHTVHPSCTINGGAVIDMNGLIYAPYCDFIINGKAGETADINAQLIGWDIKVNGANTINFNYNPSNLVKIKRRIGLMK